MALKKFWWVRPGCRQGRMLFDSERHQPLVETPWNEDRVERFLQSEFDNLDALLANGYWKSLEDEDAAPTTLYEGAMGVLWTLHNLATRLARTPSIDLVETGRDILRDFDVNEGVSMQGMGIQTPEASYFLGKSGILCTLLQIDTDRRETYAKELVQLAEANMTNPTLEALWGCPGSVIPIVTMLEQGIGSNSELVQSLNRQCEYMRKQIVRNEAFDCDFWTQDLYGENRNLTGAGHGFVGNVYPFLRGRKFLTHELSDWLLSLTEDSVTRTATVEGACANWESSLDGTDRNRPKFLVQWCHGAPGVVISLNDFPVGESEQIDQLLLQAGETIWQAGPIDKGLGLCHGTDGNGFAFLKLLERSGDGRWLERARAFAMHAIAHHKSHPGVWVGNSALALYLIACESRDGRMPLLDW